MPLTFACPRCDTSYSVAEAMAGKRVNCKASGQEQSVPSAEPERPLTDDDLVLHDEEPEEEAVAPLPSWTTSKPTPRLQAEGEFIPAPGRLDPAREHAMRRKRKRTSAEPLSMKMLVVGSATRRGSPVEAASDGSLVIGLRGRCS